MAGTHGCALPLRQQVQAEMLTLTRCIPIAAMQQGERGQTPTTCGRRVPALALLTKVGADAGKLRAAGGAPPQVVCRVVHPCNAAAQVLAAVIGGRGAREGWAVDYGVWGRKWVHIRSTALPQDIRHAAWRCARVWRSVGTVPHTAAVRPRAHRHRALALQSSCAAMHHTQPVVLLVCPTHQSMRLNPSPRHVCNSTHLAMYVTVRFWDFMFAFQYVSSASSSTLVSLVVGHGSSGVSQRRR